MVGRCIFLLKWSPFLGDIRSFWVNLCISPSQWASPDISCCFIERYHDFPTSNASFYPLDPINPHICSSSTVWGSCLILRQLKRRPCLHLKCHIFKISTHFGNIVWKKKRKNLDPVCWSISNTTYKTAVSYINTTIYIYIYSHIKEFHKPFP